MVFLAAALFNPAPSERGTRFITKFRTILKYLLLALAGGVAWGVWSLQTIGRYDGIFWKDSAPAWLAPVVLAATLVLMAINAYLFYLAARAINVKAQNNPAKQPSSLGRSVLALLGPILAFVSQRYANILNRKKSPTDLTSEESRDRRFYNAVKQGLEKHTENKSA